MKEFNIELKVLEVIKMFEGMETTKVKLILKYVNQILNSNAVVKISQENQSH